MKLTLKLNEKTKRIETPINRSLMDVLRSQGYWSVKHGCENARCGNCTIILDGQAVYSCNMLTVQADGRAIETYEGLENDPKYTPLKLAFNDFIDAECSYCLPGFILSLKAMLDVNIEPTVEEVVDALAGNHCHCAQRPLPIDAIMSAIKKLRVIGNGK